MGYKIGVLGCGNFGVDISNKDVGSYQFLVVAFTEALETGKLTPNNV